MERLRLADDLRTGLTDVDDQHETLFEWGNRVLFPEGGDLQPRGGLEVLQNLSGYVQYHFSAEERAMELNGYPGLDHHRALHNKLVDELADIRRGCARDSFSRAQQARLYFLMSDWLTYHIGSADKSFADFARAEGIAEHVVLAEFEGLNTTGITDADLAEMRVVEPDGQLNRSEVAARSRRYR
jgi:hemerythrin